VFSRSGHERAVDRPATGDRSFLVAVRHQLELAGIDLQLKFADDLPRVACDPEQIEQFWWMIMNAIDAMPHGSNLWIETGLSHTG